jgi:hypothetical protein
MQLSKPEELYRVEADTSQKAVSATLSQPGPQGWHPVAFYSRKLLLAEQYYNARDIELLAIVDVLKH